ncbi:hypothetical protein NI389_13930 [Pseudoalteromonas xiamenensis]|uniref:hypothetical protein n=1 Tax=Pseudoalteromonas xiamenensis TaxID=882626 RepID=UPI0027E41E0E|nr:hypothetical protein [Pseudoalteromonas xiamenensis]WMN59300.1 hypothetical protein NI389_13930 [Pseudoalteromonas xiamenensis]
MTQQDPSALSVARNKVKDVLPAQPAHAQITAQLGGLISQLLNNQTKQNQDINVFVNAMLTQQSQLSQLMKTLPASLSMQQASVSMSAPDLGSAATTSTVDTTAASLSGTAEKREGTASIEMNANSPEVSVSTELNTLQKQIPEVINNIDLNAVNQLIAQQIPALSQLDLAASLKPDLTQITDALPNLLRAIGLPEMAATLNESLPALRQLDGDALLAGDIQQLLQVSPEVFNAVGLSSAANIMTKALPALQQLDGHTLLSTDLSALLKVSPRVLEAIGLESSADVLQKAIPILTQLDMPALADGQLGSLLDAAPEVLRALELEQSADKLSAALPALKQLDLKGIVSGDVSSLMQAAPQLLSALEFDEAANTLNQALPALQKLDPEALLKGDLKSLLDAAPELLSAFGLQDAAGLIERHAGELSKLDVKGLMAGDLSSLRHALPSLFDGLSQGLGLEGLSADLGDAVATLIESNDKTVKNAKGRKTSARKKAKSRQAKKVKGQHADEPDNNTSVAELTDTTTRRDTDSRPSRKPTSRKKHLGPKHRKGKAGAVMQVAGSVMDIMQLGGLFSADDSDASSASLGSVFADLGESVPSGEKNSSSRKRTKKGGTVSKAAKNAKGQKLGSKANLGKGAAKGSWLKGLGKSPVAKVLGKASGPLNAILGAADIAATLNDDSLTKAEKAQQIGASAGSMGGAMAGAAAGAAIGSIIPGVGTLIGGAVGGIIGSFGGESLGGWLGGMLGGDDTEQSEVKQGESRLEPSSEKESSGLAALSELQSTDSPQNSATVPNALSIVPKNRGQSRKDKRNAANKVSTKSKALSKAKLGQGAQAIKGENDEQGEKKSGSLASGLFSIAGKALPGVSAIGAGWLGSVLSPESKAVTKAKSANKAKLAQGAQGIKGENDEQGEKKSGSLASGLLSVAGKALPGVSAIGAGWLGSVLSPKSKAVTKAKSANKAKLAQGAQGIKGENDEQGEKKSGSLASGLLSIAGKALPGVSAIGAGWLGSVLSPDENTAGTEGDPSADSGPLSFIKNKAINPFNAVASTMSILANQRGNKKSPIHAIAKVGSWAGDALNWHTAFSAANDDSMSTTEKAGAVSSTLGGMYAGKAAEGALGKSKNPALQALAPAAGFLANGVVGGGIKALFGLGKKEEPEIRASSAEFPSSLSPEALTDTSTNKAALDSTSGSSTSAQTNQVTVNANITVNAGPNAQPQDIAIQIKQVLEQQQQRAMKDVQARYYNSVA